MIESLNLLSYGQLEYVVFLLESYQYKGYNAFLLKWSEEIFLKALAVIVKVSIEFILSSCPHLHYLLQLGSLQNFPDKRGYSVFIKIELLQLIIWDLGFFMGLSLTWLIILIIHRLFQYTIVYLLKILVAEFNFTIDLNLNLH